MPCFNPFFSCYKVLPKNPILCTRIVTNVSYMRLLYWCTVLLNSKLISLIALKNNVRIFLTRVTEWEKMFIKTSIFREKIEIIMHIFSHFWSKVARRVYCSYWKKHPHTQTQKKYNSFFCRNPSRNFGIVPRCEWDHCHWHQ